MLFVALFSVKAGTEEERLMRRTEWDIPEGIRLISEYCLLTPHPECIFVFEAENFQSMMQITGAWNDVYDIDIFPAAKVGELLKEAKSGV